MISGHGNIETAVSAIKRGAEAFRVAKRNRTKSAINSASSNIKNLHSKIETKEMQPAAEAPALQLHRVEIADGCEADTLFVSIRTN
jgi:ActR/RegA family two-component response regulator